MKFRKISVACSAVAVAVTAVTMAAPATASSRSLGRIRPSMARATALRPSHGDALTRARRSGKLTAAEYALVRARSLFHLKAVRARWGHVAAPGRRDATLILRDLAFAQDDLSPSERRQARILLARPTQGSQDPDGNGYASGAVVKNLCSAHFCLHWVETTEDAVSTADTNGNGKPDFIDQAQTVFDHVWQVEIDSLGFRPPESDIDSPDNGGDEKLDVYFADVGAKDLFGFCGSDDPDIQNIGGSGPADISGYCVLDNDFSPTQFPGTTPLEDMEVTAAHEFFHAVQFAYDALEDNWLLEGTAVWMEDVVYDEVNDYYQYLDASQLGLLAGVPLDYSRPSSDDAPIAQSKYGASIFFHFLSDSVFGTTTDPDRSFMRAIFEHADSTHGVANNEYSLQAVESVIAEHDKTFTDVYRLFGVANLFPASFYGEGAAYVQETQVPVTFLKVSASHPRKSAGGRRDHLTQAYVDFKPGKGVRPGSKLRVTFNGPPATSGGAGSVVVLTKTAGNYDFFRLNASGDVTFKADFGKGNVTDVVVVLTNASTALACGENFAFSCKGRPLHDDEPFSVTAKLLR